MNATADITKEEFSAVTLSHVTRTYKRDEFEVRALDNISLSIPAKRFVAIMGPSGSGKTTLLNLVAGIDHATSGRVAVGGEEISTMNGREIAAWRARHIGLVFQFYNLIPVLTAFENVELPLLLTNLNKSERKTHVEAALKAVGLADRMGHYPRQLSGGQEQRVAIARAIVTDPTILVADEPTGDLDAKSAEEILNLLTELNRQFDKTIVMVTHDPRSERFVDTVYRLDNYFEEAAGNPGIAHEFWVRVDDSRVVPEVCAALDNQFANSSAETRSASEAVAVGSFLGRYRIFMKLAEFLGLVVVVAIGLVAANTAAMSIRERRSEIAVMRSIGFPSGVILRLLVGESLIIALSGGAIGCGVAFGLFKVFALNADALGPFVSLHVPPFVLAETLGVAVLIGVFSAYVPARAAAKRSIVETLRLVD